MKTDELRRLFLEFFRQKGHEVVPSDSLVPKDDPTLLFTGAGMNQFKDKFLGKNITYRRAASCQKCLRTGDLENVGKTSGHHTFFEMLGNFSFGDYFKKEAISWAWEFFIKELKIEPGRLWASVYKDDPEAYAIWKDIIGLPEKKIIKFGEKENFWPSEAPTKGPNGPCGPCSEIFYDYGSDVGCRKPDCGPACDCGRFIEVWNMVFTQFDRQSDRSLKPLPNKNIDTGMGLERLASVMQGVKTNFEIDIFAPVLTAINQKLKTKVQKAKVNAIADHVRAVTFCIADGVMPSNEGRGYVVRKLIRRAFSHGQDLGLREPFLYKLVATVSDVMKEPYPEILAKRDEIAQILKKEEENFLFVIKMQLPKVEEAFRDARSNKKTRNDVATTAFNFYDTYGMPYDMLEELAEKLDLKIDRSVFENLLEKQRMLSRAKTKIKGEIFSETFAKKVASLGLKTEFLGYEEARAEAKVVAVLDGGEVVLDRTPFYGESGGQVGDWGKITTASGEMDVEDAKKIGNTIVHIGKMLKGQIREGELAHVVIDEELRKKVMANHTATHLLQAALRKVLGGHVRQTGSLVDGRHLRFDFTHMKKMEEREVARVEGLVNDWIKESIPVKKELKDIEAAKKEGAIALFGEKYEDKVRVITIGGVSKELCGGTHEDNTSQIGIFKIIRESSIASGVRRIEALTGDAAKEWMAKHEEAQSSKLKAQSEKEAKKKAVEERLKKELEWIDDIIGSARRLDSSRFIGKIIENADMKVLRVLSDRIRSRESRVIVILATVFDGKIAFVVALSKDLVGTGALDAGEVAREFADMIGGSGGGRDDFAQGGGKDVADLEDALEKIFRIVQGRER